MNLITEIFIPIKTVSESNSSEHWTKKHKRHKCQKNAVHLYITQNVCKSVLHHGFPIYIELTRISPRSLDIGDNLPCSLKPIRDYIANRLKPGLQIGRADDCTKEFIWIYKQKKGEPKQYGVKIGFYHNEFM